MTTLVMLAILLFGIMAYRQLPVSDLPNVDFPTIQVSASLPGASPETMAPSVATPLERQFSTIAGLDSMTSVELARLDDDHAAVRPLAQPRRRRAGRAGGHRRGRAAAPAEHARAAVVQQGQSRRHAGPLSGAQLPTPCRSTSSTSTPRRCMAQRISTVGGVAQVQVYGSQKYAVRIQLDPARSSPRAASASTKSPTAIQQQQRQPPTGALNGPHHAYTVQANGQLMQRRRLPAAHRRLPQRRARCASRARHASSTTSRTTRPPAWFSGKRGDSSSPCRSSRARTPWKSSDARQARSCRSSASELPASVELDDPSRPRRVDPRVGRRREVHAAADALPRHPGDLPVPAERLRDDHPQPRAAACRSSARSR